MKPFMLIVLCVFTVDFNAKTTAADSPETRRHSIPMPGFGRRKPLRRAAMNDAVIVSVQIFPLINTAFSPNI